MRKQSVEWYQHHFDEVMHEIYTKSANDQHFHIAIDPVTLDDPKSKLALNEIKSLVLYAVYFMISTYLEIYPSKQRLWQKILGVQTEDLMWQIDYAVMNSAAHRRSDDSDPIDACVQEVIRMIEAKANKAMRKPDLPEHKAFLNCVKAIYQKTRQLQWQFSADFIARLFGHEQDL